MIRLPVASLLALLCVAAQEDTLPEGEITFVDEGRITINLGKAREIRNGDQLKAFSKGEYVRPPGSKKGLYVAEGVIARLVVIEVGQDISVCSLASGERRDLEVGLRVVLTKDKAAVRKSFPPLVGRKAKLLPSPRVASGEWIRVTVKVSDEDDDLSRMEWSASGGLLERDVTTGFVNRWLAPSRAGDYTISVQAVDRRDQKHSRTFVVSSTGKRAATSGLRFSVEATLGGGARHFARISDLTFDADGAVWILDDNLRRVIHLGPNFIPRWFSGPHDRESRLVRMAHSPGYVVLLDEITRRIRRVPPGASMFASAPEAELAGRDVLTRPHAMRIDPDGHLWVVDPGSGSVKVFRKDGAMLASLGERTDTQALFDEPIAVDFASDGSAWILDRAKKTLLHFRNFLPEGERKVPVREDLVDFRLQKQDDSMIVLSESHAYRIRLRGAMRLGPEAPLEDPQMLAVDPTGRCYVVGRDGTSIERLNREGRPDGRWGGIEGMDDAEGIAVSPTGEIALWSEEKVWWMDRDGWVRSEIDLKGNEVGGCWLADRLWVLDATSGNVFWYEAGGARKVAFQLPSDLRVDASRMAVRDGELLVLDPSGKTLHSFREGGKRGRPRSLAPVAGEYSRLQVGANGAVYILDGATLRTLGSAPETLPLAQDGMDVYSATSDDGELFFFVDEDEGLWYFSSRMGRRVRIRLTNNSLYAASVAMDGYRRVYVLEQGTGRVVRLTFTSGG